MYLKDTTDFINFIEKTKVAENVTLVSMDVTSLYTNIPQEQGIDTVCKAYETFYGSNINPRKWLQWLPITEITQESVQHKQLYSLGMKSVIV